MKKVLVVVDMLKDFVNEDGKLYCGPTASAIVPEVVSHVKKHMAEGNTIFFLCDSHDEDDLEFEKFPVHCVSGTEGSKIIDELEDAFFHYDHSIEILKTRYSGFYDTALGAYLRTIDPDVVEVVGLCTSICVMDTVGGLANRDYKVRIFQNAVLTLTRKCTKWH